MEHKTKVYITTSAMRSLGIKKRFPRKRKKLMKKRWGDLWEGFVKWKFK